MCRAITELIEDGRQEGIQQGIQQERKNLEKALKILAEEKDREIAVLKRQLQQYGKELRKDSEAEPKEVFGDRSRRGAWRRAARRNRLVRSRLFR